MGVLGFWSSLRPRLSVWGLRGLVGLLFEICIVDASIFVAGPISSLWGGVVQVAFAGLPFWLPFGVIVGWVGVCCFDVVETSYEGHMVDALASRADEGRWSLR